YTMAGAVVLVAMLTSSIAQPLFGYWADRRTTTWLVPVGIATSAVGIALAPLASDYALLLLAVAAAGLGVGIFHPEAMKLARHASWRRPAGGVPLFRTGGTLGMGLGPLAAGLALPAAGAPGGLLLLTPGAAVTLLLLADYGSLGRVRRSGQERVSRMAATDRHGPFRLLLV